MPGTSNDAQTRFPHFVLKLWAPIWTPGKHFWDISGVDFKLWFTLTFKRHFHVIPGHLTPPFVSLFWRISKTRISWFSLHLLHQSLGFKRRACSFACLFPSKCSSAPTVRPCLVFPCFLPPFWDPEGAPFPSGSASFSWVVFGALCTGMPVAICPNAPVHGYI